MYMRMARMEPVFGSFGAELSTNNPFDQAATGGDVLATAGISGDSLAARLGVCAAQLAPVIGGGPAAAADCAWNELRSMIMANPQAAAILEVLTTADCATALSMLGIPPIVVTAACALGGGIWSDLQAKAAAELQSLTGNIPPSKREQYEANYGRGRDRTPAEGGGHTLVDESGMEVNVECPGYVGSIGYDAAGNPAVYVIEPPNIYGPGAPCPQDVPGVVRGSTGTPVPVPSEGEATTATTTTTPTRLQALPITRQLMLRPPGRITGRVVDEGGKAVVGAKVKVGSTRNKVSGTTDATGAFDVSSPAVSNIRIYVSADGFIDLAGTPVAVRTGTTANAGTLTMKRVEGGTLKTEEEAAWYSSPWVWVAGLALVGVAGYGIYKYTRK